MGLTFTATIDFVAIEIGKVLETLELTFLIDTEIGDKGFCTEARREGVPFCLQGNDYRESMVTRGMDFRRQRFVDARLHRDGWGRTGSGIQNRDRWCSQ
jgi:hypothetical protein